MSSTRTPTPRLAAQTDDHAIAVRRYQRGERPDQIADALETDLETVIDALRGADQLAPHDDPDALAHLFHDGDGHTLKEIAGLFGDACSPETIRDRMERFGIERSQTGAQRLASMSCEDLGLAPKGEGWTPPDEKDPQQTLDAFGGGSA